MTCYTVEYSRRRTLSVEITRECAVLVRAPLRTPAALIDAFVSARTQWIESHLESAKRRAQSHIEPDEAEKEYLRRSAQVRLAERTAYYAAIMGVSPSYVKITSAKTRFGSCNGKNGICYSLYLMQYPPEAIDYVVVHELCHIRHKNHGPDFYAELSAVLPDHKERRKLLKGEY